MAEYKDNLLGEANSFLEVLEQVSRLAPLDKPVLVIGERGTGKELIANRLHFLSSRWQGPFISLNCAALNENLLDSELFGHEAGAFTGASKRHPGRFERADGGTLFLDELATAPMLVQEKLLRVIEYGELERVGGSQPLQVNVRLVCATNADLPQMVENGHFRADLYLVEALQHRVYLGNDGCQDGGYLRIVLSDESEYAVHDCFAGAPCLGYHPLVDIEGEFGLREFVFEGDLGGIVGCRIGEDTLVESGEQLLDGGSLLRVGGGIQHVVDSLGGEGEYHIAAVESVGDGIGRYSLRFVRQQCYGAVLRVVEYDDHGAVRLEGDVRCAAQVGGLGQREEGCDYLRIGHVHALHLDGRRVGVFRLHFGVEGFGLHAVLSGESRVAARCRSVLLVASRQGQCCGHCRYGEDASNQLFHFFWI